MLTMGGRTILNIRDFRRYFSPADALRQHRAFAAFAVRTLSRTDDCSRVMSMLFALASMQMDGRIDRLNPGMLPHLRVPYQTMRALLDAPVPTPDKACEHMRKLVSCFAQEEQTALLVPMRTSRAAAELAAQCGLTEARKGGDHPAGSGGSADGLYGGRAGMGEDALYRRPAAGGTR